MLELVVEAPNSGNTGGRYFPCTGHFGISKVIVAGTVSTRIPPLSQPLLVKAVYATIRCIENRTGGALGGSADNILWQKTKLLWESPEYIEIGEWSKSFNISIPPDAAKVAASAQSLKEWKSSWRFEIAIEHKPIPYVGNRIAKGFLLNILNHTLPNLPPPTPPIDIILGSDAYTTSIHVTPPHGAFGPEDSIDISFHAKPEDPTTIIKKAIASVERIIEYGVDTSRPATSFFRRSPSPADDGSILATTTSAALCPGEGGFAWGTMKLVIPKRSSRWDIGETIQTKLITVRYQLKIKFVLKAVKSRSTRELIVPPIPIYISPVSTAERSQARLSAPIVHVREQRKHRSSRRGLYMHEGTVGIDAPATSSLREGRKSRSVSPRLPRTPPTIPGLKPILLPADHPVQGQSISFIFPSPPPHATAPQMYPSPPDTASNLPSINNLISSCHIPPVPLLSPPNQAGPSSWSRRSQSSEMESFSIIKQFQQTGRRISTTISEEEAILPSRSRQKLVEDDIFGSRPSLPSLDALGLGLPHVQGTSRRPVTAPAQTSPRPAGVSAGPKTSVGRSFWPDGVSQEDDGNEGNEQEKEEERKQRERTSSHTFAFTVNSDG